MFHKLSTIIFATYTRQNSIKGIGKDVLGTDKLKY